MSRGSLREIAKRIGIESRPVFRPCHAPTGAGCRVIPYRAEIGEQAWSRRLPAKRLPRSGAGGREVHAGEHAHSAESFARLFQGQGFDRQPQAAAECPDDLPYRHAFLRDGMIMRRFLPLEGWAVQARDIAHMRDGIAVAAVAEIGGDALGTEFLSLFKKLRQEGVPV